MTGLMKLLIGGAATSLLAWGAHAVGGEAYIKGLDKDAKAALTSSGVEGVDVHMQQEPSLSRVAILSGEGLTDEQRAAAEEAVRGVDGVSGVRWAGEGDDAAADSADGETTTPSAEAVDACQKNVDAVTNAETITFRSGSSYLSPQSLRIVDAVADALKECDGMTVAVEGHTDSSGSAQVNTKMSQARADAVAAALSERGISADRVSAKGFGPDKPLEGKSAADAANRRIEFTLGNGAQAPAEEGGE